MAAPSAQIAPSALARAPRDERLDFFRGIAMFIIFIAHMPENPWFGFIPARFGFSSAAELFVFCSGLASALAFGRVFMREGYWLGARRILFRLWQVYWAHIGLALTLISVSVAALEITGVDYPAKLGLGWFFAHTGEGFLKLMSLRLMPNFLDILPMYLVLLAMIPVVMALARLSVPFALGLLVTLWCFVQVTGVNLPGGPMPGMVWYLNPFAWQLVFFTGFAFGMGWIARPKLHNGGLFWFCVAFLILSVPVNFWGFTEHVTILGHAHDWLLPDGSKTNLNPLLYLHFLASAYVALVVVEPWRAQLSRFRPIILVGQQALAAFIASILLASIGGVVLDAVGRDMLSVALVNLAGCAGLIGTAYVARLYKGKHVPAKAAPVVAASAILPVAAPVGDLSASAF
jgi:hypothetical protein